ncbi:heparinase II/III family protein [Daejeonella lutea]|uniref:Repeat domain-containing protein n=1 Tax=Daejeonella lutea TaxID=572036 RepID=A0A1T5A708_9SPHI|nr:hypothetical protein [Daejeonella lutea]SKB30774.1 hypothetical protein SAMN05661099_0401 [Daejeonella lutea]
MRSVNKYQVFSFFLCLGCVLCFSVTNIHANHSRSDTALYKKIVPRTLDRSTGIRGINIVVPDHPDWKALGRKLQILFESKGAAGTKVSVDSPQKFSSGWTGNTLLLGNVGNSKQMARLYGLRLSYADAIYPGSGGYQLLTLVNPFGLAGNTIILATSDIEGAKAGVARLSAIVNTNTNNLLPWIFEAELSSTARSYFNRSNKPTSDREAELLDRANSLLKAVKPVKGSEVIADALLAVLTELKIYGEYYQLTADPVFGKMYKALFLGYARFVNTYPDAALAQLHERRNMWIQGEKLLQNWSVLEASPIFSDSDRNEILSALYLTCKANAGDRYLVIAPERAPRWNHEIFPAMSIVGSVFYFDKYFELPEVNEWLKAGERIFKGNTSYISMDEGSDYLSHLPMVNIDYAMATGDLKYIDKRLRPSADLHSMMIDNLGTLSGGGDTYPFGMSSAYSWGHSQVLNAASWYYKDPIYNFLLERTRTGPFPGQKLPDLNYPVHRYIVNTESIKKIGTSYPRVQAQEIESGVYDELQRLEGGGTLKVEQGDTFHKLTFRSGFGTSNPYLILDGFSAGKHGHQDGNAILNYSANGRLFLNDRDYIQNTPEYHSGLVIVKNGQQFKKPPLVKLQWVADIEGTSFSRSTVHSYNGGDWDRTIISPDGEFFIIYDDLKIKEHGNYMVRNHWQSLGSAKIHDNAFDVEQDGVTMRIQSLTNASLRMKDIYGHFKKYWKTVYPYPYADNETVLTELSQERKYEPGDKVSFINVLSSHTDKNKAWKSKRLNESTIELTDGVETWFTYTGEIIDQLFKSNGILHLQGKDELISAGATKINIGSTALQFSKPVFFKIDLKQGKWKTYSLNKSKLKYNDAGEPIYEHALDSGQVDMGLLSSGTMLQVLNAGTTQTDSIVQSTKEIVSFPGDKLYSFEETVTSSAAGDLDGDKKDEIILAGENGKITAITSTGTGLWNFTAKGRINEISIQMAGNRPLVLIATENWFVHVLDSKGNELWNYKFNDDQTHREYKGNLLGITNIRLANTKGRGEEPVVMVGTQFRYIYELDLRGKLLSDTLLYFYGIEDMEYADLDGDGKDEGVFALEYYYYALRKGKDEIAGKNGGPGFKVADVIKNTSEGGLPGVLLGSKQSEIRLIHFKDKIKEQWVRNVGGEVNDIRNNDFDNDGKNEILVGTEGFQFYVLDESGKVVFRKTLGDRVLKVAGFTRNSKTNYLAATAGGQLSVLSPSGQTKKIIEYPSEITNIISLMGNTEPIVVLKNGEIFRVR